MGHGFPKVKLNLDSSWKSLQDFLPHNLGHWGEFSCTQVAYKEFDYYKHVICLYYSTQDWFNHIDWNSQADH